MKRILALCLVAAAAGAATGALALGPGEQAPDFFLASAKNSPVHLADYRGKVVYLDFWASWCAPCRKSFPWMNELKQRFAGQGLEVLAVNVDSQRSDAEAFLAAHPAAFTVAFDDQGKTASIYQVKGMPSSYLIDREGKVRQVHLGFRDDQKQELEGLIRQTLEGAGK